MTELDTHQPAGGIGTPKLNKALSQLQGELPPIKKTKTADVKDQAGRILYKYSYADLGDVVADVGPLLAKYGLAFMCAPTINPADRREMVMGWSLLHESGEEKSGEWPLGPVNQKPQSLGSGITYGRRYCFTAATNIVLEDDDDGQRAQQDHGGTQSAGDAWETAAPAAPRRDQQGDAPKGDQSWAKDALRRAKAVKSDAEAAQLIRETTAAHIDGRCDRRQQDHIQNTIGVTLKRLREAATPVDVEDLAKAAHDSPRTARGTAAGDDARNQHHDADPAPEAAGRASSPGAQPLPPPGEPDYDTPGTATTPQIGAIWTVLSTVYKFGKDEKDQARAVCAHIAGHPLESTKNMSRNEAKAVLDTLAEWREVAERHEEQPREFLIELLATAQKEAAP